MGATTQQSEAATVQPRDNGDNVVRRATEDTATTVGQDNGRTAIGTSAGDIGKAAIEGAARAMTQMRIDNVTIGEGGSTAGIGAAAGAIEGRGSAGEQIEHIWRGGKGDQLEPNQKFSELIKHLQEPTKEQRDQAQQKLDDQISKLLKPEDQKTLGDLQKAIVNGDHEAFGKAIAGLAGDPEKRDAMVKELNKNLEAAGSSTRAVVDSQGNVVVHNGGDTGVVYDKNGKATVREIKHRPDGGIVVGGEVIGGKSAADVMKEIGNGTAMDIAGPKLGSIDKNPRPLPMPDFDWPPRKEPFPFPMPEDRFPDRKIPWWQRPQQRLDIEDMLLKDNSK